ncbi:MAG: hypothetical protein ACIAXF_13630 [Phycisphaerales bacterium JB063]
MMTTQRFAILEHSTDPGVHHDLLIEDPALPAASCDDDPTLWAVRIAPPPHRWQGLRTLELTPLPHHRRRYLTYEGPISAGRGRVRRVAQGDAELLAWSNTRRVIRLAIAGHTLTLTVTPAAAGTLTAHITPPV